MHSTNALFMTVDSVKELLEYGTSLLKEHGLEEWGLRIDRSKRRAGLCNSSTSTISVSRYLVGQSMDSVRNILLHEIAHALVGAHHGHDDVWRQKALDIGCDGRRCHDLVLCPARYRIACSCGRVDVHRYRMSHALQNTWCQTCQTPATIFYMG